MAEGVRKCVLGLIRARLPLSEAEAERKLEDLKANGRYVEEIFGADEA